MTPRAKILVTLVLLALLGSLGAADYYLSDNQYAAFLANNPADDAAGNTDNADDTQAVSSVPFGAVAKAEGPKVEDVADELGLSMQANSDLSLLAQVAASGPAVQSKTLLKENDRIGSVTWTQSPEVKNLFIALKEALIAVFSPELRDLKDETVQAEGLPTRNLLTFLDPSLSEERIVFIRVRERLYEFHVAPGKESSMNEFVEALTTR